MDLLDDRDWEAALQVLMWREAAFQNFKVADSLELKVGNDLADDKIVLDFVADVTSQNVVLEKKIAFLAGELKRNEMAVAKDRTLLGKFHSGQQVESQINSTV